MLLPGGPSFVVRLSGGNFERKAGIASTLLTKQVSGSQLGFALLGLERLEAALPHFEKALQLSPRDQNQHWFYNALGECHFQLGDTNAALNFWRKARAANSQIYLFPLWLAAGHGLQGDINAARIALAESLKLKSEINSLARLRADKPGWGRSTPPEWVARRERTYELGLRRAGMPDE